jgi:hypothetical protein
MARQNGRSGISISARDRRALGLAGAVIGLAVLYVAGIKPFILSVRDADARIAQHRELLQRERDLVAAAPQLQRVAVAMRRAATTEDARLYPQRDPVAATAALSRDVAGALEEARVALQRSDAHDVIVRKDGLRELSLDVRAEGDLDGIMDAITALETNDRLIRVARLSIERSSAATPGQGGAEALSLIATVRGYSR